MARRWRLLKAKSCKMAQPGGHSARKAAATCYLVSPPPSPDPNWPPVDRPVERAPACGLPSWPNRSPIGLAALASSPVRRIYKQQVAFQIPSTREREPRGGADTLRPSSELAEPLELPEGMRRPGHLLMFWFPCRPLVLGSQRCGHPPRWALSRNGPLARPVAFDNQ